MNDELNRDKNKLLDLVKNLEQEIKNGKDNLEEANHKINAFKGTVDSKVKELDDIRFCITKVAELFERKEIKQHYSFEVLCDFIKDKA